MSAWWHSTLQSVTHLLCPLTDGGIKRCFRLTSVYCVHSLFYSLFRPNVENREAKIKIGTEVAHVTRDSDTTSKVKKSRSPGLFTQRALTHEAHAAVTVRTYWAWEATATLRLLGGERGAGAPTGGRAKGHIVSPCSQLVLRYVTLSSFHVNWLLICWQHQPYRPSLRDCFLLVECL